jgi:hypothetical protein
VPAEDDEWLFGPYLAAWISRSKLSVHRVGELSGVSEGRIRQLINGYETKGGHNIPVRTKAETVRRLSDVLGFPLSEGMALARLTDEPPPAGPASLRDWTLQQLLADIGQRFNDLQVSGQNLPPGDLDPKLHRARGHTVARLDTLALEADEAGDHIAATALRQLRDPLNRQLVESVRAAQRASEDQTPNH